VEKVIAQCVENGGIRLRDIKMNEKSVLKEIQDKANANISKIFNPNNRIKRIEKEISDMIRDGK
jgi:hypothetical protein